MPELSPIQTESDKEVHFMDQFRQIPIPVQRIIIGVLLLSVIAVAVILRDKINTAIAIRQQEELLDQVE